MRKQVTLCDVCGAEKKDVNHWYLALPESGGDGAIVLRRWDDNFAQNASFKHLCGQRCVISFVNDFMAKPLPTPDVEAVNP